MKNRLNRFTIAAIVCAVSFASCACSRITPSPAKRFAPTSAGWEFDDGQRATVANYKGKVLLLDFYATWCEPCRLETPHLVTLHHKYEGQGLQVVGLNVGGTDDHAQIPAFKTEFGIAFPLAIPDDDFVDEFLGINQNIPQTFVIDRQGAIVQHFIGYSDERAPEIERAIQAALNKR